MKSQYTLNKGKYKGLTTSAETVEQAKKNIKAQIKRRESKLTQEEKYLIAYATDLVTDDPEGLINHCQIFAEEGEEYIKDLDWDKARTLTISIYRKLDLWENSKRKT